MEIINDLQVNYKKNHKHVKITGIREYDITILFFWKKWEELNWRSKLAYLNMGCYFYNSFLFSRLNESTIKFISYNLIWRKITQLNLKYKLIQMPITSEEKRNNYLGEDKMLHPYVMLTLETSLFNKRNKNKIINREKGLSKNYSPNLLLLEIVPLIVNIL